jgi:hypothetical protein
MGKVYRFGDDKGKAAAAAAALIKSRRAEGN